MVLGLLSIYRVLQTLQVVGLHMSVPLLPDAHGTIPGCGGITQGSSILVNIPYPKIQEYPAGWDQTLQLIT